MTRRRRLADLAYGVAVRDEHAWHAVGDAETEGLTDPAGQAVHTAAAGVDQSGTGHPGCHCGGHWLDGHPPLGPPLGQLPLGPLPPGGQELLGHEPDALDTWYPGRHWEHTPCPLPGVPTVASTVVLNDGHLVQPDVVRL